MRKIHTEEAVPYQFERLPCDDVSAINDDQIIERALRIVRGRIKDRAITEPLTDPHKVRDYLTLKYALAEREIFSAMLMDNRHRVIEHVELFFGTINSATIHPREIVKSALACNAATVVLVHNHPSGNAEPSIADKRVTTEIVAALALIDVRVLDHMIVAGDSITSFAERGLL